MKCTPGSARINRKILSLCLARLGLKGITESRAGGGVLTKALLLQAEAPATEVREKLGYLPVLHHSRHRRHRINNWVTV